MKKFRQTYDRVLEAIAVLLIVAVTAIVTMGFVYRWVGASLVWYDEVASIALCWLTYYASALAALRGPISAFPALSIRCRQICALPPRYSPRSSPLRFSSC